MWKMIEIEELMMKVHTDVSELNNLLKELINEVRIWKEWDKKHHLEEVRTKELFEKLINYLYDE